jgi:hypothetical protein
LSYPALRGRLVILRLLLGGLLLELDDRHAVQVAVCPAVVHTVLEQVLCRERPDQRGTGLQIKMGIPTTNKIKKNVLMVHGMNGC